MHNTKKSNTLKTTFFYLVIALLVGGILHTLGRSWERYQSRRDALHRNIKADRILREYWPNGRLLREIPMVRYQIHGFVKSYDRRGILRSEVPYRFGKRYGKALYYDDKGKFQTMQYFRDDRPLFPLSLTRPFFERSDGKSISKFSV